MVCVSFKYLVCCLPAQTLFAHKDKVYNSRHAKLFCITVGVSNSTFLNISAYYVVDYLGNLELNDKNGNDPTCGVKAKVSNSCVNQSTIFLLVLSVNFANGNIA